MDILFRALGISYYNINVTVSSIKLYGVAVSVADPSHANSTTDTDTHPQDIFTIETCIFRLGKTIFMIKQSVVATDRRVFLPSPCCTSGEGGWGGSEAAIKANLLTAQL